jgi:hypothetical protein
MSVLIYLLYLIVGMLLGQRFKVLILVPVVMLVVVFASAESVAAGSRVAPAEMVATAAVSLQIGNFLGACLRYLLMGDAAKRSTASTLHRAAPNR